MKTVWIANRYITKNLGDRILGNGLENILSGRNLKIERVEYTGSPSGVIKFVCQILRKIRLAGLACFIGCFSYLPKLLRENPSVIFVGGGQLLFPNKTFLHALLAWSALSILLGFKLVIFSVGTERIDGAFPLFKKLMLKFALGQATAVRLRDYHSQALIKDLFGKIYPVVPDTAYGLNLKKWKVGIKKDLYICPLEMGSVLRFGKYSSRDGYFEEFLNSVSKNIQKKDHVFLFSSVNDDYDEMKNLFGYLSKKIENKISVIPIGDEDTLLENLGRARVVISSRMHPLIFAHILGARPVAIDASEKIKSFSENFLSLSPQDLKEELRASIDQLGVV